MAFRLPIIERRTMTIFSRKGTACPQCAEFKTHVKMESPAHLQRTLCHIENAVALGILRDVGKAIDPEWSESLAECRALGNERDRFGWYDSLSLYFECTHCQRRYHLRGDTYHGNVWREQAVQ